MGGGISKRGSYDFSTKERRNDLMKKKHTKENTRTSLTPAEIYEDLTKLPSPAFTTKPIEVDPQKDEKLGETGSIAESRTISVTEDEYKSLEQFSDITRKPSCNSDRFFDTVEKHSESNSAQSNDASKQDFASKIANSIAETELLTNHNHYEPETKLFNEYSHVITAESIEKLRDILIKREECVVSKRPLLKITEQDEGEEDVSIHIDCNPIKRHTYAHTNEYSDRKVSTALSYASDVYYELDDEECEDEGQDCFYDAVSEELQPEELQYLTRAYEDQHEFDENIDKSDLKPLSSTEGTKREGVIYVAVVGPELHSIKENLQEDLEKHVSIPDIITTQIPENCNDDNTDPELMHYEFDTNNDNNIKRWKSCNFVNSPVIFPVENTTLDIEWLSKRKLPESPKLNRPTTLQITKSTPNLFTASAEEPTPEEIAEDQMRLWSEQQKIECEAAKIEILSITLTIKDIKSQLENDSMPKEEPNAELYQSLIKLMRDVNNVHATDFNQEVLELKNSALVEVYDCLKLLQIKIHRSE